MKTLKIGLDVDGEKVMGDFDCFSCQSVLQVQLKDLKFFTTEDGFEIVGFVCHECGHRNRAKNSDFSCALKNYLCAKLKIF